MFLMYCKAMANRLGKVADGKVLKVQWKLSEAQTLKKPKLVKFVKKDQSIVHKSQLETDME